MAWPVCGPCSKCQSLCPAPAMLRVLLSGLPGGQGHSWAYPTIPVLGFKDPANATGIFPALSASLPFVRFQQQRLAVHQAAFALASDASRPGLQVLPSSPSIKSSQPPPPTKIPLPSERPPMNPTGIHSSLVELNPRCVRAQQVGELRPCALF